MVPMLTWGLLRMNFSFDTDRSPSGAHQVVAELLRYFGVVVKLERVRRAASGLRPQIGRVPEHRGHRDETGDGLYTRSRGNSSDFSPSGMQIAEDFTDVLVGSHHLEGHDRLEDRGDRLVGSLDKGSTPGDLEGVMV